MVYTYIQTKNQSLSVRQDQDQDHVDPYYFALFAMLVLFVFFPAIVWILFFCVIHLLLPLYYAYSGNLLVAYSGAPVRTHISPPVKPVEDAMDVEQYGHKGDRTFTCTTRTCAQSPYIPLLPSSTPLPPSSAPGKGGILGELEGLLEGGGVDLEGGGKGEWEEEEEGELVLHERCVTYYPFMQQLDGGGIGEEGMWRI